MKNLLCLLPLCFLLAGCGADEPNHEPLRKPQLLASASATIAAPIVVIPGYRDDYSIVVNDSQVTVTAKDGIVKNFSTSQQLQFFDRHISFNTVGSHGQAFRLYQAAFNREPDVAGLGFWIFALENNTSIQSVSSQFQGSDEFRDMYGTAVSNDKWISLVYNNVLHRAPDAEGLKWWASALDQGADRAEVLVGFSESDENKKNLAASYSNGIEYVPFDGADQTVKKHCGHNDADKPAATFSSANISTNDWGVHNKNIPYIFTYCVSGRNILHNVTAATFEWSLPQSDWQLPEGPNNVIGNVKAFLEIYHGHQLYGATSANSLLPIPVAEIDNLAVHYDVKVETDGIEQTFFDVVFTAKAGDNVATTDIVFYVKPTKVSFYGAPFVETITLEGVTYDVYLAPGLQHPRYSVSFVVKEEHLTGTFKLKPVTEYLLGKGFLSPNDTVETIEFGTEVISGTGKTTINHFRVTR